MESHMAWVEHLCLALKEPAGKSEGSLVAVQAAFSAELLDRL